MPEIADLETLRDRLGHPATTLCLGNGPTSEGPDIPLNFDCLFRVNWVWRDREFLVEPDVVFTGDPDEPTPGSGAIIGFPTEAEAQQILRNYPTPTDWFKVSSLLRYHKPRRDHFMPTNGALMIAVAVALAPRRLVISGIDLYLHPQGKYPGGGENHNTYDAIHSRETDITFMRYALSLYQGELAILSNALSRELSSETPK
jgi:hypothetical protein